MSLNRGLPGETPLDDISGLKLKHIRTVAALAEVEFENTALANTKYLTRAPSRRMAPFTLPWMLRVHREMFGNVWAWAGKRRTTDGLNLGVPAIEVEIALEELSRDLSSWRDAPIGRQEEAAILHHRAVSIHPFLNGNGRWARLLGQIWQLQHTGDYTHWPESQLFHGQSNLRAAYIRALQKADVGDMTALIRMQERLLSSGPGHQEG